MRLLFLGDIVGKPGRIAVQKTLTSLRQKYDIDFVVANGENAAGGFGINMEVARELFNAGVDVITMGNHTWKNREVTQVFQHETRVLRPANYPEGTPGEGYGIYTASNGERVAVLNLLGLTYLEPMDCPFRMADRLAQELRRETPYVILDFHAEATSEKKALGYFLDGKISAVLGTHTHVTTADEAVLPNGTAYITDVGMCGPIHSVLGVESELAIRKFVTKMPVRFEVAGGSKAVHGVVINLAQDGLARSIERVREEIG
jgi:metallophosphoesterase (TIGR00282 family)